MIRKRIAIVVNAGARTGVGVAAEAIAAVEEAGHEAIDCSVETGAELKEAFKRAVHESPDAVFVGGGDGTMTLAAQALAPVGIPMGVLPLGTTNNFARSLDLPLDWREALTLALQGEERVIYLGTVNGHIFCNVAAAGVSVNIAQDVTSEAKRMAGRLAYGIIGLQRLTDHQSFRVSVRAGKRRHRFRTHEVIVVNGRFHSAREVAPQADPDKSHLVIAAFGTGRSRWQLIKSFGLFILGRHRKKPSSIELTYSSFRLNTRPSLDIEVDGEVLTHTPAEFGISPHMLKVLMPVHNKKDPT